MASVETIIGALKDISDQVVRTRSLETQAQDAQRSQDAERDGGNVAENVDADCVSKTVGALPKFGRCPAH